MNLPESLAILEEARREHAPIKSYALLSGGHDSLCATHIAMTNGYATEVAHINTGIGVEETREFVRATCKSYGWPLRELHPPAGHTYDEIVLREGFPGPASHHYIYNRIKERALRQLIREAKAGHGRRARVMLVSGSRRKESQRRMGHAVAVRRDGVRVWAAPIIDWLPEDKHEYIAKHGLPRNQVVETLCMSGECLCGAFAKPDEILQIKKWYPRAAARIADLEERAKVAGVHCKWGTRPPRKERALKGQMDLCWSCHAKYEKESEPDEPIVVRLTADEFGASREAPADRPAIKPTEGEEKTTMSRNDPIYSDAPDAEERLLKEIAIGENTQAMYREINATIRKNAKNGQDAQVQRLVELGAKRRWKRLNEDGARKLLTKDFAGRIGVPHYELKNNNANVRRLKKRLEEVRAQKTATAARVEPLVRTLQASADTLAPGWDAINTSHD